MVQNKLEKISRTLSYHFKEKSLLKQALTHRSANPVNNERLEFLGDSALSLVIAQALFEQYPDLSEGKLSRLRSILVRGETLAEIALELNLGDYLILGQGEMKSGGFRRKSILADALEAIFAAIYLDGGFTSVKQVILSLYKTRLASHDLQHSLKDSKTRLQEYLQGLQQPLPLYELLNTTGDEHEQIFHVRCQIPQMKLETIATGLSRRSAEQCAAKAMLDQLNQ